MKVSVRRPGLIAALLAALVCMAFAEQGARYLIITADQYVGAVQPLAQWKTQKGMLAKVVPLSVTGSSATQIRNYILNAYSTWPVPPEYVLIVGSPDLVPPSRSGTDDSYGDMSGDYEIEIPVGRFFATTLAECSTLVAKTLIYEQSPFNSGDSVWMCKGTTIVNEDSPVDPYYQPDCRYIRGLWAAAGYVETESLMSTWGNSSTDVRNAINDGRSFVVHRGQCVSNWWPPFDQVNPATLSNGDKLPVVVSGSCQTLTLNSGESMLADEFVRAGTAQTRRGAVAYFGTSSIGEHISQQRGTVTKGFFAAVFTEKRFRLGDACLRGKRYLDSLMPGNQTYYQEWVLLGDPELNLWTAKPRPIAATYDSVIPLAPQTFNVTVTVGTSPVANAIVCAWMDSVVYVTGTTNASGQVALSISPTHVGTMKVTVTGPNMRPFVGACRVMVTDRPYLFGDSQTVDEYVGNGDHIINPGESFHLTIGLRNIGGAAASGVTGTLHVASAGVVVHDSSSSYGAILQDSVASGDPYDVSVDTTFAEGQTIGATLRVRDAAGDSWSCPVTLTVRAGRLELALVTLSDLPPGGNGNGRLGRGESGRLAVAIRNSGGAGLSSVRALLVSLDTNAVVTDSEAGYGSVAAGETLPGDADRFGVSAGPGLAKNQPVQFQLTVWASGGTYHYWTSISVQVPAEQGLTNDPTGPDAYGYWCYDNTDTSSGRAPTYGWFELAPPGPGTVIPAVSDSDAAVRTLTMPFQFKYYGSTGTLMSACSNGFLAFGSTTYRRGTNGPIPDTSGPNCMIAPFWDDLNPDENSHSGYGTAYQYSDSANHRWIVEYDAFAHYNQGSIRETFEAAFYDPAYVTTPTGDGEIVFQYSQVALGSSCTVGIEDATHTRGIQYLYNNSYASTAAYLQAGRAIKFTTVPPRTLTQPWLVLVAVAVDDSTHGNGNHICQPGETLAISATILNRGAAAAGNCTGVLRALDANGTVLDSSAALGSIGVGGEASNGSHPFLYQVSAAPLDSACELGLLLSADGYQTVAYFSVPLGELMGVETGERGTVLRTGLGLVRPNPLPRSGVLDYSLARPGLVDLALFDAVGRRVRTIERGQAGAGRHTAQLGVQDLSMGVYFCRLQVEDAAGSHRFVKKIEVAR